MKKPVITGLIIAAAIAALWWIIAREVGLTNRYYLVFSELSQVKRDLGTNVGPIQLYYGMINDVSMKVFEANNISQERSAKFATELEIHVEPTFKIHRHNLVDLLTNLKPVVSLALAELSDIVVVRDRAAVACNRLSRVWDDDHDDVYHTEYYTVEVSHTDSKGNTYYTTETRSKQVYDYTIHTYTFSRSPGDEAVAILTDLIQRIPAIIPPETLVSASQTGAEGEYAAERSISADKKKFGYDETTNLIRSFHRRAAYTVLIPGVIYAYQTVGKTLGSFSTSLTTAKSTRYRTYSHGDDGPREFQTWERFVGPVNSVVRGISGFVDPMVSAGNNAESYLLTIRQHIAFELDKVPGKVQRANDILATAEEFQIHNFQGGPGLHKSNGWFHFFTFLMIAVVLAGAIWPIAWLWRDEAGF